MREKVKHVWFRKVPASIRKPLVLIIGSIFMLAAVATGWLPGPGGIPLFLVGIAILATEFAWAERFRDRILEVIRSLGREWRAHKIIGTLIAMAGIAISITVAYYSFSRL